MAFNMINISREIFKVYLTTLVLFSSSATYAIDTIGIATGEWAPYISETLPDYGNASKVVNDVFKHAKVKTRYGFFPWTRAYEEAKKGTEWQVSTVWVKNPDREKDFYFSLPVYNLKTVLFVVRDSGFGWKNPQDLSRYTIGGTHSYDYGPMISKGEKAGWLNIDRVSSELLNFKKLIRGRVDAVLTAEDVGQVLVKENFSAAERFAFTYHDKPVHETKLHIMVSKKAPDAIKILDLINKSIEELRRSGRIL